MIRSGGRGFAGVAEEAGAVDDAGTGRGGWNDCGGYIHH